ncbi:MAG: hypothetical protein V4702_01760 [Patescibacteria group bacterium]
MSTDIQRRWTNHGNRILHIADLEVAYLVLRGGLKWPLLEEYFPTSKLHQRAIRKQRTILAPNNPKASTGLFKDRTMGVLGHCALSPAAYEKWGGTVKVVDVGSAVVITHPDAEIDIDKTVPMDLLQGEEWLYNIDGKLSGYLGMAYRDWRQLLAFRAPNAGGVSDLVKPLQLPMGNTIFGEKIVQWLIDDVG